MHLASALPLASLLVGLPLFATTKDDLCTGKKHDCTRGLIKRLKDRTIDAPLFIEKFSERFWNGPVNYFVRAMKQDYLDRHQTQQDDLMKAAIQFGEPQIIDYLMDKMPVDRAMKSGSKEHHAQFMIERLLAFSKHIDEMAKGKVDTEILLVGAKFLSLPKVRPSLLSLPVASLRNPEGVRRVVKGLALLLPFLDKVGVQADAIGTNAIVEYLTKILASPEVTKDKCLKYLVLRDLFALHARDPTNDWEPAKHAEYLRVMGFGSLLPMDIQYSATAKPLEGTPHCDSVNKLLAPGEVPIALMAKQLASSTIQHKDKIAIYLENSFAQQSGDLQKYLKSLLDTRFGEWLVTTTTLMDYLYNGKEEEKLAKVDVFFAQSIRKYASIVKPKAKEDPKAGNLFECNDYLLVNKLAQHARYHLLEALVKEDVTIRRPKKSTGAHTSTNAASAPHPTANPKDPKKQAQAQAQDNGAKAGTSKASDKEELVDCGTVLSIGFGTVFDHHRLNPSPVPKSLSELLPHASPSQVCGVAAAMFAEHGFLDDILRNRYEIADYDKFMDKYARFALHLVA